MFVFVCVCGVYVCCVVCVWCAFVCVMCVGVVCGMCMWCVDVWCVWHVYAVCLHVKYVW